MQLNVTTGYAVRMVMYLAQRSGWVSGTEVCEGTAIPPMTMSTVVKPLRNANIITARRGNNGGFALARSAQDISMADIVRAMEGTTRINSCLEEDCHCTLGRADTCKVRRFYLHVQEWVDKTFEEKTIASLLEDDSHRLTTEKERTL